MPQTRFFESAVFLKPLVEGEGFEPSKAEPSDLQSDPFDRSGTPPKRTRDYGQRDVMLSMLFCGGRVNKYPPLGRKIVCPHPGQRTQRDCAGGVACQPGAQPDRQEIGAIVE